MRGNVRATFAKHSERKRLHQVAQIIRRVQASFVQWPKRLCVSVCSRVLIRPVLGPGARDVNDEGDEEGEDDVEDCDHDPLADVETLGNLEVAVVFLHGVAISDHDVIVVRVLKGLLFSVLFEQLLVIVPYNF